jgi:sulfoxide reductase heme-binding subunit YedZ
MFAVCIAVCVSAALYGAAASAAQSVSIATAYASFALLAITLAIGPFRRMMAGRYPLSTHLRRDIGVWAGILALVHVVAALQVHAGGRILEYFVWPRGTVHAGMIRFDPFGIANILGAAATAAIIALLITSNDRLLGELGAPRWKLIHGATYPTAIVVIVHGLVYAILERRTPPLFGLFTTLSVGIVALRQVARSRFER